MATIALQTPTLGDAGSIDDISQLPAAVLALQKMLGHPKIGNRVAGIAGDYGFAVASTNGHAVAPFELVGLPTNVINSDGIGVNERKLTNVTKRTLDAALKEIASKAPSRIRIAQRVLKEESVVLN